MRSEAAVPILLALVTALATPTSDTGVPALLQQVKASSPQQTPDDGLTPPISLSQTLSPNRETASPTTTARRASFPSLSLSQTLSPFHESASPSSGPASKSACHNGNVCPNLEEAQNDNEDACHVDCVQTSWSSWSTCPKTSSRRVENAAAHASNACGNGSQTHARSFTIVTAKCDIVCGATAYGRSLSSTTRSSVHRPSGTLPFPFTMLVWVALSADCPAGRYSTDGTNNEGNTCIQCPSGKIAINDRTSCKSCPAGKYADSDCKDCPAGKYSSSAGSSCSSCPTGSYVPYPRTSCQSCPAGKYSFTYISGCRSCPAGTYSSSGNSKSCSDCSSGQYASGSGSSSCDSCPAGKYSSSSRSKSCSDCSSGQYVSSSGSSSCTSCPSGYYQTAAGRTACIACARTKYGDASAPRSSSTHCKGCEMGKYQELSGATLCNQCRNTGSICQTCFGCPAGYAGVLGSCHTCPNGYFSVYGAKACNTCPSGYFNKAGARECTPCPSGKYEVNRQGCADCVAAKYQSAAAQTSCEYCPQGHSSKASATDCDECTPGRFARSSSTARIGSSYKYFGVVKYYYTYSYYGVENSCSNCPKAYYQPDLKQASCRYCPKGKFNKSIREIECTPCSSGKYEVNRQGCTDCEAGKYQSADTKSSCIYCPRGYTSKAASSKCDKCPTGSITGRFSYGASTCTKCSVGKYSKTSAASSCSDCPAGKYLAESGRSECITCAQGSITNRGTGTGSIQCTDCPAGQYGYPSYSSYSYSCKYCPAGRYSTDAKSTSCATCLAGSITGRYSYGASTCTKCSVGKYSKMSAVSSCSDCPAGKYHQVDRADCKKCLAGNFSSSGTTQLQYCSKCEAGQYSEDGAAKCTPCPKGYHENGKKTLCISCPKGQFSVGGIAACIACGPGKFQHEATQSSCSDCPSGYYQRALAQSSCDSCDIGRYQFVTGADNCSGCAGGSYQPSAAQTSCKPCPEGKYSQNTAGECRSCERGKYQRKSNESATKGSQSSESCRSCPQHYFGDQPSQEACKECPAGKYSNDIEAVKCEVAEASFYLRETANGEKETTACPKLGSNKEATCSKGILRYNDGYWHDGLERGGRAGLAVEWHHRKDFILNELHLFYACPCQECCAVDPSSGVLTCERGSDGLLCSQCRENFYRDTKGLCQQCEESDKDASGTSIAVVVVVVVVLIIWRFPYHKTSLTRRLLQRCLFLQRVTLELSQRIGLIAMVKIVCSFYQILLLLGDIYEIPYPKLYVDFLFEFNIFTLSFSFMLSFMKLECVRKTGYYEVVYLQTSILFVLELVGVYAVFEAHKSKARARFFRQLQAYSLITAYFFYSPTTAAIFQVFNCRDIDGGTYLQKDLSLDCTAAAHASMEAFAGFMAFTVACGLPAIYFGILHHYKTKPHKIKHLAFFTRDYTEEMPYWECVECFKRLLLAGAAVFFGRGSLMQIVISATWVLVHLFMLMRFQPYRQHNFFALVSHITLFFVLFASIFIKLDQGWESKGIYPEGFSIAFITGILIFCATVVIVAFFVETIWRTYGAQREIRASIRRSGILSEISQRLAKLPLEDPPPGPDFYAINNGLSGSSTVQLEQLKKKRVGNHQLLRKFFKDLCGDQDGRYGFQRAATPEEVMDGHIFLKLNHKSDASALGKCHRDTILYQYPRYQVNHLRDYLRFKCCTNNVEDGMVFLDALVNYGAEKGLWNVVKLDIHKLVRPKLWGWRFIGADLKMNDGMLVECYVVSYQMDRAKKFVTCPKLADESNHELYEHWRGAKISMMTPVARQTYEEEAATSRIVYNRSVGFRVCKHLSLTDSLCLELNFTSAFYETMRRTALYQWEQLFSGFSSEMQTHARELYVHMIEHRGRYDDQEDANQLEKAYEKEEAALPTDSFYNKMPGDGSSQAGDSRQGHELEASKQSVADLRREVKMLKEKLAERTERSRGLSYGMDFPTSMGGSSGSDLTNGSMNPMFETVNTVKPVRNPLNFRMCMFRARPASTPRLGRPDQCTSANPMFSGRNEGEWQRFEEDGLQYYWNELLPSWYAYDDEEGERYYFNSETNETTYDMPAMPAKGTSSEDGNGGSTTEKASKSTSSITSPVSSRVKAVAKHMSERFSVRASPRSQRNTFRHARRKDTAQSPVDRQRLEASATTDWVPHKTRISTREQRWAADNAAILAAAKAKASSQTSLQTLLQDEGVLEEAADEEETQAAQAAPSTQVARPRPRVNTESLVL